MMGIGMLIISMIASSMIIIVDGLFHIFCDEKLEIGRAIMSVIQVSLAVVSMYSVIKFTILVIRLF